VYVTWEAGDGARLAELAVAAGQRIVVAGGGDGTVNEVATGLMRVIRPQSVGRHSGFFRWGLPTISRIHAASPSTPRRLSGW